MGCVKVLFPNSLKRLLHAVHVLVFSLSNPVAYPHIAAILVG